MGQANQVVICLSAEASRGGGKKFKSAAARRSEVQMADLENEKQKEMMTAVHKEFKSWVDSGSAEVIQRKDVPQGAQVLRSRCVLTLKDITEKGSVTGNVKCKCRFVVLGFEDWRAVCDDLQTDAPTVSRVGGRVANQISLTMKWNQYSGDVSTAFLRGDKLKQPIFAQIPRLANKASDVVFKITKGVFGLLDAPRLWYQRCSKDLIGLGAKQCLLDPCIFLWFTQGVCSALYGIIVLHVDDMRAMGSQEWVDTVFGRIKALYVFGAWEMNEFRYTGLHWCLSKEEETLRYDLADFVQNKIHVIQNDDLKELEAPGATGKRDERRLSDKGWTRFRAIVGGLQWLTTQGRPDLGGKVGTLSSELKAPVIGSLRRGSLIVKEAKETMSRGICMRPVPFHKMVIVSFSDSSFGKRPRAGHVLFVTVPDFLKHMHVVVSLLNWGSKGIKRAVDSTYASEGSAMRAGLPHAKGVRDLFRSMLCAGWRPQEAEKDEFVCPYGIEVVQITDCGSLYDSVTREGAVPQDDRMRNTILCVKDDLKSTGVSARWTPTKAMLGDALTKWDGVQPATREHMLSVMEGRWAWRETFDQKADGADNDEDDDPPKGLNEASKTVNMTYFGWHLLSDWEDVDSDDDEECFCGMAGTSLRTSPDYGPVKEIFAKVRRTVNRIHRIVVASEFAEEWPEWMRTWSEWSHYLVSGPGDFFEWWYNNMPFIGMLLETLSLLTIIWNILAWANRKVRNVWTEPLFAERAVQTDTHWNHRRNRYYYGHASVMVANTGTRADLHRANLAQGPMFVMGNQNVAASVERRVSQHVLDALGIGGEQCVLNNPGQGLTGIGTRVPPTAPPVSPREEANRALDEQEAAENVAAVAAMYQQEAEENVASVNARVETGGSSSSSGNANERQSVPDVDTGARSSVDVGATSGAAPEADMERFFRPAGTGSGERTVDEKERKRSVDRAWQTLQREQLIGRAWEEAEETARRRERAIAEEQERIRKEREEQAIAAELGRQRRAAEEEARVRNEREAQEREAAAETLRQAHMATARAKAQAKYLPRGPRGSAMGFGHYHNWTYEAVWNHDKQYCEWAMRENLTSSRRSQKLIQFAGWCVRRQHFGPMGPDDGGDD